MGGGESARVSARGAKEMIDETNGGLAGSMQCTLWMT